MRREIFVDDEIYDFLVEKRIGFETPNEVLRRLLLSSKKEVQLKKSVENNKSTKKITRQRAPKTNLKKLANAGFLKDGETLYLHDFTGKRIPGYEAQVSGNYLRYKGEHYSMSELALMLLKKAGDFNSSRLRGPAFGYNYKGISVKEMWTKYLNNQK